MSTKHNHLASSPSSSVAASVETSNLKNRRLYQVWKGNNVHILFTFIFIDHFCIYAAFCFSLIKMKTFCELLLFPCQKRLREEKNSVFEVIGWHRHILSYLMVYGVEK